MPSTSATPSGCLTSARQNGDAGVQDNALAQAIDNPLGRMAIARPWIFAEFLDNLQTSHEIFQEAAIQLIKLLGFHYDPIRAIKRFKRFSFYFCANFRFGHALYTRILNAAEMTDMETIIRRFFEQPPDIQSRPNMNYFR